MNAVLLNIQEKQKNPEIASQFPKKCKNVF